MSEKRYVKPLPRIDEESRGYWEALARHELYVQRCRDCGTVRFPPRALCTHCMSPATEWLRCSGRGTVYSFTVTHQNQAPGFREELPYVLAIVELAEGPRVMTNIVGCAPDAVRIGMAVEVVFDDVAPGTTLAKFRPA
ncbi:MAG: Zn-ribbon domain-containing OB-fold protein [bacterium]|nr:Zn-ribbon domain-containing OB-fold protein [bacterium]